ncbi:MAG: NAD(P)-dependent oxidoreductase [Phycisphaeraceae bacterium]|nr:NAD(P)-dependent oxidoreductase [Phycisphaeraceae bacterium]
MPEPAAPRGQPLRIGWIGTGVMGAPMAGHLLRAGHAVTVFTRTPGRAEALLEAGARWAETPAQAARDADVVCSIVGMPDDVSSVHLGPTGTLTSIGPGTLLIDFTTSSPSLAVSIAEAAAARGALALDAPVSGGDIGAREARLSIMVGGAPEAFARAEPLLRHLGPRIVHQGGPGAGQHTKMVNQVLIAATMIGVCEGLLYAEAAGLDPSRVIESVGAGAAGSWSVLNLGPRIIQGDFGPGFMVEHFLKDLGIALAEADRMNLALPGLSLARQLYLAVRSTGGGRLGTQSLILALRRLSGCDGHASTRSTGARPRVDEVLR